VEEGRKRVLLIAASILVARHLKNPEDLNETIHGMLSKRNECAHPNDFFPDMNMTLGYISELLSRVAALQPKKL
jgi:hypothetical protein